MARNKLDLNALEVDSFPTVEQPARAVGTVHAHVLTNDCDGTTNPASWDAGCTIGCTTNTNLDGPTCGYANCNSYTWNRPTCAPQETC